MLLVPMPGASLLRGISTQESQPLPPDRTLETLLETLAASTEPGLLPLQPTLPLAGQRAERASTRSGCLHRMLVEQQRLPFLTGRMYFWRWRTQAIIPGQQQPPGAAHRPPQAFM